LQWVITRNGAGLALRDPAQEGDAVHADRVVDRDVLRRDGVGLEPGGVGGWPEAGSGATLCRCTLGQIEPSAG